MSRLPEKAQFQGHDAEVGEGVEDRRGHDGLGPLAQESENQRREKDAEAPEMELGEVPDRKKDLRHPEGGTQGGAEELPALGPGVAQARLHVAAIEEFLREGDHEELVDDVLPEFFWQAEGEVA